MRIPYQYRKVDSFIDEMDILAYAICTNRNKDTNFSAGRIKRINEQNAKELKVLRNKIKHQTRCTFERVYALMHFEDEM